MILPASSPVASSLAFSVLPYPETDGERLPAIPDQCPYHEDDPDRHCRVVRNHLRYRTTGPCIPLQVCRCGGHARAYTLYPPGFGPYSRCSLAPVTLTGKPIRAVREETGGDAAEAAEATDAKPSDGFAATYFQAAIDGAEQEFWPREAGERPGYEAGRYRTQIRQIDRAAAGLGLSPAMMDEDRLRTSRCLGSALVEEAVGFTSGKPGSPNQEQAWRVCGVLSALGDAWCAVKKLTHAFYLAGVWGLPSFWDGGSRVLRTEPFRRPGTGGPR